MIHDPQHTITALSAKPPSTLELHFADGLSAMVDLGDWIARYPVLAPLADPDLFVQAKLDARGGYVVWREDALELAADNLRNLAIEQSGGIGPERLWRWMDRNQLTRRQAAEALGLSVRTLGGYLSGARPIPKTVWLACLGWESSRTSPQQDESEHVFG